MMRGRVSHDRTRTQAPSASRELSSIFGFVAMRTSGLLAILATGTPARRARRQLPAASPFGPSSISHPDERIRLERTLLRARDRRG